MTITLNPKVALLLSGLCPQFISHDAPSKMLAFIFLETIFDLNSMLWCALLAWFSAKAGSRLRIIQGWSLWLNRSAACLCCWVSGNLID